MKVYRQGDVILVKVGKLPPYCEQTQDALNIMGETGETHSLPAKVYTPISVRGIRQPLQQFIDVGSGGALMVHPQHPSLQIDEGVYNVRRVRTYTPNGHRDVQD